MALSLLKYESIWVEAINTSFSKSFTLDFTQSNALVMCYPNQVNSLSTGAYGNATIYISSYVQSGKKNHDLRVSGMSCPRQHQQRDVHSGCQQR
jgi:hypothetical protein